MITVLQLAQLPNIKVPQSLIMYVFIVIRHHVLIFLITIQVATVLLCCAFCYDIFWVFVSPKIFGDSVMVAVSFNFLCYASFASWRRVDCGQTRVFTE